MNTKTPFHGVFISDLDGTLLDDSKAISSTDHNAFIELYEKGILRVIATGRSLYTTKLCLPDTFPVDYVIASSGSHVIDWKTGSTVKTATLQPEQIDSVRDLLQSLDVNFMVHEVFPENHCFAYNQATTLNQDFERRLARYTSFSRKLDIHEPSRHASQILTILGPEEVELYEHIAQACAHLSVIRATSPLDDQSIWVEIFAPKVSKAEAISHLIRQHELEGILTGAIGNDHNDEDMLDLVNLPYIVENAFLEKHSRYHKTPDNNNNAVSYAIDHFMNILFNASSI